MLLANLLNCSFSVVDFTSYVLAWGYVFEVMLMHGHTTKVVNGIMRLRLGLRPVSPGVIQQRL